MVTPEGTVTERTSLRADEAGSIPASAWTFIYLTLAQVVTTQAKLSTGGVWLGMSDINAIRCNQSCLPSSMA